MFVKHQTHIRVIVVITFCYFEAKQNLYVLTQKLILNNVLSWPLAYRYQIMPSKRQGRAKKGLIDNTTQQQKNCTLKKQEKEKKTNLTC